MAGSEDRVLRHGTTRQRAEAILCHGPNPNFREPGEIYTSAGGFSTAPVEGPFPFVSAEVCAVRKAALFPNEGGPAILEIEVPLAISELAIDEGGEVRFIPGWGLEELLIAWPTIPKRIL